MAQETLEEEDGERDGDGDVVDVEHGGVASWRLAAPVSGDGGIDPTAIAGGGCDGGIRAAQAEHGASAGTLAGRAADDASGAGTAQCSPESSVDARFARFAGKSGANDDGVEDCFERQEPAFDAIAEHSDAHNMKPPQPVPLQSSPPQPPPLPRPSRRRAFEISSPLSLTPREDGRSSRLHQRPLEQQRQQQQQQHRRLPSSDSGRASRGARELPSRGKRLVAAATGRQALSRLLTSRAQRLLTSRARDRRHGCDDTQLAGTSTRARAHGRAHAQDADARAYGTWRVADRSRVFVLTVDVLRKVARPLGSRECGWARGTGGGATRHGPVSHNGQDSRYYDRNLLHTVQAGASSLLRQHTPQYLCHFAKCCMKRHYAGKHFYSASIQPC
eukprot:5883281-Pleurochrysis_carterae.AAC.1